MSNTTGRKTVEILSSERRIKNISNVSDLTDLDTKFQARCKELFTSEQLAKIPVPLLKNLQTFVSQLEIPEHAQQIAQIPDFVEFLDHFEEVFEPQGIDVNHHIKLPRFRGLINMFGLSSKKSESKTDDDNRQEDEFYSTCSNIGNQPDSKVTNLLLTLADKEIWYGLLISSFLYYIFAKTRRSLNVLIAFSSLTVAHRIYSSFVKSDKKFDSTITITMISFLSFLVTTSTYDDVEDNSEEDTYFVPQAFETVPIVSTTFLMLLTTMVGYKAKSSVLDAIISVTKITDTQSNNVMQTLMIINRSLSEFFASINMTTLSKYFEIEMVGDERIKKYQLAVGEFTSRFNTGDPQTLLWCSDVYEKLYKEGATIQKTVKKSSFDSKVIDDCLNKLLKIYTKIADLKITTNGERVETVGLLLKGKPGVKKGALCKLIGEVVANITIPVEWRTAFEKDPRNFYYAIQKGDYWDSYTNQAWISYYDDIFQVRDTVGMTESDATRIIGLINSAPYPLTMAKIEEKNKMFFRSAYLMGTSNIPDFNILTSVTDPYAVRRRFHFEILVEVNPKYKTGDLIDNTLLPKESDESTRLPFDYWDLTLVEYDGKNQTMKPIELKNLIRLLVDRHDKHKKNFLNNENSRRALVEEMCAEYGISRSTIPEVVDFEMPIQMFNINNFLSELELDEKEPLIPQGLSDNLYYNVNITNKQKLLTIYDSFPSSAKKQLARMWNEAVLIRKQYSASDNTFYTVLTSILHTEHEYTEVLENFDMDDYSSIVLALLAIFDRRIIHNLDPITGGSQYNSWYHVVFPPIVTIQKTFLKMVKFFEDNLWTILIGGTVIYVGIEIISKIATYLFAGEPQSIDHKNLGKTRSGPRNTIKLSSLQKGININHSGIPVDFGFKNLPKFKVQDFGLKDNKNDVLTKVFNKYFYIIYLIDHSTLSSPDFTPRRLGHCLNVEGKLFLMPLHYIYSIDSFKKNSKEYRGASMIVTTSSGNNRFTISLEEFLTSFRTSDQAADKDLCLLNLQPAQSRSKGAISFILKKKDIDNLSNTTSFRGVLIGSSREFSELSPLILKSQSASITKQSDAVRVKATWELEGDYEYNLFDTYSYKISCQNGDCGSLLIPSEANFENRIICGFHVIGNRGLGYSTGFDQESIRELIDITYGEQSVFVDEEKPTYLVDIDNSLEPQNGLTPIYDLQPSFKPAVFTKSEITRSKIFGKLPPPHHDILKFPARLNPFYTKEGNLVNPMILSFSKYNKIPPDIPIEYIHKAINSYENLIYQHCNTSIDRNIIPLDEALHSFNNINSISSSTSSGFPMSLPGQEDLKKKYYGACNTNDLTTKQEIYQRIANLVDNYLDMYKRNVRPFWAYKQCGKDEIIDLHKWAQGKLRCFAACPFILLVLFRMYFGVFISSFVEMNLHIGSAVGVNPYSTDWDSIARKILQFSSSKDDFCAAAGDQGQFDARQWPIIHEAILEMIIRWYGDSDPEANKIRRNLFTEILNSKHIFDGKVYEWNSGLPSGNPLTAIINTIYNHILFRMCWIEAGHDIHKFNKNVYIIILGDDNLFSVSSSYRETFNEISMVRLMETFGNKYTNEVKISSELPFRKLTDIEFLKRSFRLDPAINRYVAPLQEHTIVQMLNWTKKKKEGDQITVDNMLFALREFSLHGEDKYNYWLKHLLVLKQQHLTEISPHGEFLFDYNLNYSEVLNLDYNF